MAHIATPEFLSSLKQLYPPQPTYLQSPWYAVAAITFSAANCPEAVPLVLEYVLGDLSANSAIGRAGPPGAVEGSADSLDDRLVVARKIRDALFKSGMICGFPKVINALMELRQATPTELRDTETLRNPDPTFAELRHAGRDFFDQTYGETAGQTRDVLNAIYPDLGFYTVNLAYGYGYSFMGATSPAETSFAMISALIAIDTPRQVAWHLKSALRNGATREEVRAVREIAIRVSSAAGVVWKQEIPDLD